MEVWKKRSIRVLSYDQKTFFMILVHKRFEYCIGKNIL